MSDIPPGPRARWQMAAIRDVENKVLPPEAIAQFVASKGSRDGSNTFWLLQWANGTIPRVAPPRMRERMTVARTQQDSDNDH